MKESQVMPFSSKQTASGAPSSGMKILIEVFVITPSSTELYLLTLCEQ
jgi:hypothetical protein